MKKLTRERVVPTISASTSWEIDAAEATGSAKVCSLVLLCGGAVAAAFVLGLR